MRRKSELVRCSTTTAPLWPRAAPASFLRCGATDPQVSLGLKHIGQHLVTRVLGVLTETTGAPARPARTVAYALEVAVALAHHHILVGDDWAGITISRAELAEETSRMIGAYLRLEPTITIRQAAIPEGAPTTPVRTAIVHPSPFEDE